MQPQQRYAIWRAVKNFDLEGYLGRWGSEAVQDDEHAIPCPTCGKAKLVVNLKKRVWHCWYCEGRGDGGRGGLLDLIQLLEGISRKDARFRVLGESRDTVELAYLGDELVWSCQDLDEYATEIRPPANWRWVDDTGILPYCRKRGISTWDARNFRLMWCTAGRYAGRLIFPVWEDGDLVYWQARAMWEEHEHPPGHRYVKCLNPPRVKGGVGAGEVLFNLDQARKYSSVVITEGPIDAIHVGPDAVCTFGKKLSDAQIGKLLRAGVRRIELMWDGPSRTEPQGAWPEMFKIAEKLREVMDVRLVFLSQGDPGDYTCEQLLWFRRHASRTLGGNSSRLKEI